MITNPNPNYVVQFGESFVHKNITINYYNFINRIHVFIYSFYNKTIPIGVLLINRQIIDDDVYIINIK